MKNLKSHNGITLIALVITIIVLLILAGISISMLSGDNGILQKATTAKTNTDNAQIQEQINLAYHSALVNGQGEVTETSLETELKNEFNKSTLDEGWLDKTSAEGKWKITIDGVPLEVPAGVEFRKTGIDFGDKTAETIQVEDDITIGTEKFKVIKKSTDGKTITAIPYYNIMLTTTNPVQITDGNESSYYLKFSESKYWNTKGVNIESMSSSNIQQYITAYQETLEGFGANNVTAKIGRYYGAEEDADYIGNLAGKLNPTAASCYWLGSSLYDDGWVWLYNYRLF